VGPRANIKEGPQLQLLYVLKPGSRMNFIERYLGFAPDNHDGSLEAIILIAVVTVTFGVGVGVFNKHRLRE
jgi:hypothetical protein